MVNYPLLPVINPDTRDRTLPKPRRNIRRNVEAHPRLRRHRLLTAGKSSPANPPSRANCNPRLAALSANLPCPRDQAAPTPACTLSPKSPASLCRHASRPPISSARSIALFPASIRILEAQIVPDTFHARHSAVAKTYEYRVLPIEPAALRSARRFLRAMSVPYSWRLESRRLSTPPPQPSSANTTSAASPPPTPTSPPGLARILEDSALRHDCGVPSDRS